MRQSVNPSSYSGKLASNSVSATLVNSVVDGLECSSSSPSRLKSKKREREDDCLDPMERTAKLVNQFKLDIRNIFEKRELTDSEAVDKIIQLIHTDKDEKKLDLVSRSKIAKAIASTSDFRCLSQFVELRGVSILDDWLQEVHKGKTGSGTSLKEGDKSVEEFISILLNALNKLPVNLHELRTSNIGKSVNMLRSHKNMDIQKKARRLVDLWKKRVEAELVHSSAKAASTEDAIGSAKSPASGISHWGNRSSCDNLLINHSKIGSVRKESEAQTRVQLVAKSASDSIGSSKSALIPAAVDMNQKDFQCKLADGGQCSDVPLSVNGDNKSCSSSLSHNCQSCSSDPINTEGCPGKEDSRSSSAGSMSMKTVSKDGSCEKRLIRGLMGPSFSGIHKETRSKRITLRRSRHYDKISRSESNEKENKLPISDGYNKKLIVKFPNRVRWPVKSVTCRPPDEPSLMGCKPDLSEFVSKGNSEDWKHNLGSDAITESWQSNESKDPLTVSDEGEGNPATTPEKVIKNMDCVMNLNKESVDVSLSSMVRKNVVPIHKRSTKFLSVAMDGCARDAELFTSVTPASNFGMNLLADVATGEMAKSDMIRHRNAEVALVEGGPCLGRNDLSANAGKHAQEPSVKLNTFGTDEDIEMQIEAGATLAMLRKGAPGCLINDSLVRDMDSSIMQVKQTASLVKNCIEKLDKTVVTSYLDAMTNEMVVRQNNSIVLNEEADEILDKPISKFPISECGNTLENVVNGIIDEAASKSIKVADPSMHIVATTTRSGDGSTSAAVSNLVKKGEENVLLLKEFGKNIRIITSAEIHPNKPDKIKCQTTNLVDSWQCINPKAEQKNQEQGDESGMNLKMDANVLPVSLGHKSECVVHIKKQNEFEHHCEAKHDSTCKLDTGKEVIVCVSANTDVISPSSGLASRPKFEFDLNECCDAGKGVYDTPVMTLLSTSSAYCVKNSLPDPISGGFSTPVTVAAAAKGPFNPPGDLLKNKREVGWKGSAATSAFRPAEPRKALAIQSSIKSSSVADVSPSKETHLNIDLNVAYEDTPSRTVLGLSNNVPESVKGADSSGFDLNLSDQVILMGQRFGDKDYNPDLLPYLSKFTGSIPAGPSSNQKGFDLNNCLDDVTSETICFSDRNRLQSQIPITSLKMNSVGMGNLLSWFPGHPVSTQPVPPFGTAVNHPVLLPAAGEPQRFISISNGLSTGAPEGPVFTSSPALSFNSSFQHANFPFGTSFPMVSASFPGSPVFVSSSSGRRQNFVPGPSQLSGPGAAMYSNYYPRPFLVSVTDNNSNIGRQPWDLNARPGGPETEGRNSTLPYGTSQLSFANAHSLPMDQARMYQAAGTVIRRQVPEGNWDTEKQKQHLWH
uniref:TFIIS N-terminal domain-containing protein n=1 Tax=Kalanchoe fedtschenkoi TaxID=63787 RepID=A0A7N0TYN3_KALFE